QLCSLVSFWFPCSVLEWLHMPARRRRVVRAVKDADTTTSRKWACILLRPVRGSAGVDIGGSETMTPGRSIDDRPDHQGPGRGRGGACRELPEPYRRELHVHCYRMLGSLQDAEDVLQDTLLAAWQGLGTFEGRASIRTWLYRIATNRCLNALRSASRRRAKE